jgi:hypothetical protein
MLVSIFKRNLGDYLFYTHFFYIPIILATFWWGKRGIWVSIVLGLLYTVSTVFNEEGKEAIFSAIVMMFLFFISAVLVATLTEEKNQALRIEREFKLDTAHFFFNPLCIAEGNIDLTLSEISDEAIKAKLKDAQYAVQRIKKVIINVVEAGEVRE